MKQNLVYALIQVVHNFGAVAIVGLTATGWMSHSRTMTGQRKWATWLAAAWLIQATAGIMFNLASIHFSGRLPDIHGVAVAALAVKAACTLCGFLIAMLLIQWSSMGSEHLPRAWGVSLLLAVTALISAAFLRWFS